MSVQHQGRLLLIRHGLTAGNTVRYVGWEDEPLSETGREQANSLVALLHAHHIDAVYASPLARAKDTARPLADARGLSVIEHEGLKEINYGRYQGQPKAVHPVKLRKAHTFEPMPGGESLRDVQVRLGPVIDDLRGHVQSHETVAMIAHFWTNRILLGTLLGIPLDGMFETLGYKPKNASVLDANLGLEAGRLSVINTTLLTPDDPGEDA